MGTKNSPGKYDCYAHAEPDEPMFVLLGRDPRAPALIDMWATMSELKGTDPEKIAEARTCANAMRCWQNAPVEVPPRKDASVGEWWSGQTCEEDGVYGQYSDTHGVRALPGCEYHMTKGTKFPPSINNHHFRLLMRSITIRVEP